MNSSSEALVTDAAADAKTAPGGWVIVVLVLMGMIPGALLYHLVAPAAIAESRAARENAPTDPAGRASLWAELNTSNIDNDLLSLRLSSESPWIASHGEPVASEEQLPLVWGTPVDHARSDRVRANGLLVEIVLDPPRPMGRAPLGVDRARHVPLVEPGQAFDDEARLREIVMTHFHKFAKSLAKDVPGAELVVVFEELPALEGE